MIPLWRNPEFIRNCRAQLRPRRLLLVASIVSVLSLVLGYSMAQAQTSSRIWGDQLLTLTLYAQMLTLYLGGGFACSRSISQEREQNTFDFQRVTQLTSLELAVGKLFGAPAISYFATICMLPAAIISAGAASVSIVNLLAAYVILFTGAIAVHAITLLLSLGSTRTAGGVTGLSGAGLLFVILLFSSAPEASRTFLDLGPLGPGAAIEFARHGTWDVRAATIGSTAQVYPPSEWTDVFFGIPLHHFPVLLVLYLTFAAWCLVPLARNLKRDPALLELYSPAQSVGLLSYINLILVGFYMGRRAAYTPVHPNGVQSFSATFNFFLVANLVMLYCLGLALLRNREQARRRAHQRAGSGFDWQDAGWPAVYVLAGAACAAVLFLARFARPDATPNDLDPRFAVFVCALLLATMLRDLCFLQWMNLRRAKRPLIVGMVILTVFYFCGSILLVMARFSKPVQTAFMAIVAPWGLATADPAERTQWSLVPGPWMVGLAVQIALVVYFAAMHYKLTEELRPTRVAAPARAVAAGD